MTPRDLARQAGVSTDTLRHYERKGLIDPPPRTGSGYRRYPPDTLRRVRVIRRALAVGFTLNELGQVLEERRRGGAPCRRVRHLVTERLTALDDRIAELTALRTDLTGLLAEWNTRLRRTSPGRRAYLLDMLAEDDGARGSDG
jgi:DNA-binding transcriptional MerR regulator